MLSVIATKSHLTSLTHDRWKMGTVQKKLKLLRPRRICLQHPDQSISAPTYGDAHSHPLLEKTGDMLLGRFLLSPPKNAQSRPVDAEELP